MAMLLDTCSSTRRDGVPLGEARAIRALTDAVCYHAFMTDLSSAQMLKQACPAYPNAVPSPETITQADVTAAFGWLEKARTRRRNLKLRRSQQQAPPADENISPLITLIKEIPWWAGRRYLDRLSTLLDCYEAIPAPMPELCYLFINEENMLREYYGLS